MAWSTLAQEATRIEALSHRPRVQVDTMGTTGEGNPIRLLRIGEPPPAEDARVPLLLVGMQHGNEPAGREALLDFAEWLADAPDGDTHLDLPGSSGDHATAPDAAALDISNEVDARIELALDDVTPGASTYLLTKYETSGNQRSWAMRVGSSDELEFLLSSNGSGFSTGSAGVGMPVGDGERVVLRCVATVDSGTGGWQTDWYTGESIDGPWTSLGSQASGTLSGTAFFNSSAPLSVGALGAGGSPAAGRVWRVQVRDGETTVADPDFTTSDGGSFDDAAGNTWTLNGDAEIVDVGFPDEVAFLQTHGVLIVPSANPDGFDEAETRENLEGQDPNRHHIRLLAPEALAISEVIRRHRPVVVVDQHEAGVHISPGVDIGVQPGQNPMIDTDLRSHSDALTTAMRDRADDESWPNELYDFPFNEDERLLHNAAGLRHAASVLVETDRTDDTPSGQEHRRDMHYAVAEEALAYCVANVADLLDDADDSITQAIAAGAAGTAPFDLRTETIDPPPVGYRMSGADFAATVTARASLGITNVGNLVTMAQAAYGVIPYLLDGETTSPVADAVRLFDLAVITARVGTVEEFAEVVPGSHQMLVDARLVTGLQAGSDPDGTDLLVLSGDVQFDATADVWATLEIEIAGVDEDTGRSLFPRRPADLLAPYGAEVFVRRGVDLGGAGELWSPLGYFGIRSVEQDDAPYGPIRLSCQDRMAGIIEARPIRPREFGPSRTVASVVAEIVGDVYPTAVIVFDDDAGAELLGRTLVMEESRHEVLLEIANDLGKVIHWDGEGLLQIRTAPDDTVPLWEVKAGADGVLLSAGRRVTRDGVHNGLVVTGEAGESDQGPVLAVLVDRGPTSPTRWASIADGGFGFVPRFYSSPFIHTSGQAATAAREMLRRSLGAPFAADFGAVVNPALRPYDPIRVTQQDHNRRRHVVDAVTIPLTDDGALTGSTREVTQVVIGGLPG